ncbi:MAG TPA: polysaccharide transporter, partial [Bacteroidales bacterium]|nr:polysaccharide transporter [Bacteroidales bacterium]
MKRILFFLFIAIMASSCVSLDKVTYLQDAENYRKGDKTEFPNSHTTDYKVQAGDNLYIDVKSLDTKTSNPFLANQSMGYQMSTEAGVYLNSYLVNDSGYINFPVVGKVMVKGLTVNDVRDRLQKVVDEYFQFTTVTVKLVNFKISLLGEVERPGTYQVYQNSINV